MNAEFDLAVVGSGFGGSLLAIIARRLGWRVILLERGRHPRFAIGESSTPLANLLWEEIAARYDLPALAPLAKWGSWQQAQPRIACGLKRGFTFLHHERDRPWTTDPDRARQLLVAASPRDSVADTHWYRPHFDQFLVEQARTLGVEFLDELELKSVRWAGGGEVAEITGRRGGADVAVRARLVIDASGPRGFLHRALGLAEEPFPSLPSTCGLYAHFTGVHRWETLHPPEEQPPYPLDDAAMHHVFEGGWIWVLRFNNGLVSAGVAATQPLAAQLRFGDPAGSAAAWARLLDHLPAVRDQFARAEAATPFVDAPRLSFRSRSAVGPGWALLPSAAGFVDPLLSTGFPLTLLGLQRLGDIFATYGRGPHPERTRALEGYARESLAELDVTAEMVGALYAHLGDFEMFRWLSFLYFAAAMFAETVRRLGRPEHAPGFLLHRHPQFGPALRRCLRQAQRARNAAEKATVIEAIGACLEPFNLARLGDPARRHWYPARAEDLLASSPKLGADSTAIAELLERSGFSASKPAPDERWA